MTLHNLGHSLDGLKDGKNFTLLHHAVLKGTPGKLQLIIETVQKTENLDPESFKAWLDAGTASDKFTALHYASYRGNLEAIYVLLRFGANIQARTATNLNMLHVAAQGDSAPALFAFKELGLDINETDRRGSTPLHWACFRESEVALSYLLAWGPDINIQDVDGNTPLHLAIQRIDKQATTRVVRFLMMRGGDQKRLNEQLVTPLELLADVKSPELRAEAEKILGPPSACSCLMLSAPTRQQRKQPTNLIMFFLMYVVVEAIEIVCIYPHIPYYLMGT